MDCLYECMLNTNTFTEIELSCAWLSSSIAEMGDGRIRILLEGTILDACRIAVHGRRQ